MRSNGITGVRGFRFIREQYARMWEKFAKRESAGHEPLAFLHSCRRDRQRPEQRRSKRLAKSKEGVMGGMWLEVGYTVQYNDMFKRKSIPEHF